VIVVDPLSSRHQAAVATQGDGTLARLPDVDFDPVPGCAPRPFDGGRESGGAFSDIDPRTASRRRTTPNPKARGPSQGSAYGRREPLAIS